MTKKFDLRVTEAQRHCILTGLHHLLTNIESGRAVRDFKQTAIELRDMLESDHMVALVDPDNAHPDNVCNDMTE